jgi:hypothetical protein
LEILLDFVFLSTEISGFPPFVSFPAILRPFVFPGFQWIFPFRFNSSVRFNLF